MAAIRPRDLLTEGLLGRLGRLGQAGGPAGDIAALAEAGYLNVALPPEFGGLGCTLRQAACGQRRLARHAPDTALAVSAHLYWTGAAADAYRAGDDSVRWILAEAAGGALFAGGHGAVGGDLRFADPRSRCEPSGEGGYRFRDPDVLSTETPAWDWIAVHAVHAVGQAGQPQSVIAFAGRGTRCRPGFRVARVSAAGTPAEVFTTSALTWGHSILASVQYSDARRAFNDAITACAEAATPAAFAGLAGPAAGAAGAASAAGEAGAAGEAPAGSAGRPPGRWPVAEAGTLLDEMKAKIAEITHPWQLVQAPTPDLGGQHLISLYAMRHEVAEGSATVHALVKQLTGTATPARPLAQ
jgi:alkylation response protein AidB-like acyl-CoA dehydrogenase